MLFSEKVMFLGVVLATVNSCGCSRLDSSNLATTFNTYHDPPTTVPKELWSRKASVLIRAGGRRGRIGSEKKDQQVEIQ